MFVSIDRKTYRVQFVHAAPTPYYDARPGSLRFIVEHLAASLGRRVTLCEISEVTYNPLIKDDLGRPAREFTPVAQGWAVCHYKDQFNKREGRMLSLHRALKATMFSYDDCDLITQEVVGVPVEELVERYER